MALCVEQPHWEQLPGHVNLRQIWRPCTRLHCAFAGPAAQPQRQQAEQVRGGGHVSDDDGEDSDDDCALADVKGSQPQSERPLPLPLRCLAAPAIQSPCRDKRLDLPRISCMSGARWSVSILRVLAETFCRLVEPLAEPSSCCRSSNNGQSTCCGWQLLVHVAIMLASLIAACAGADKENARADKPSNVPAAAPPRAGQKSPAPKQAPPPPAPPPAAAPAAQKRHMRQTMLPFAKKPKPGAAPDLATGVQQQATAPAVVSMAEPKTEPINAATGAAKQAARLGSSQKPIVIELD